MNDYIFPQNDITGYPFHTVSRGCDTILVHDIIPAWIVHYPAINNVRRAFYQSYRSCAHIPKGREPWTVDNKALGNREYGFLTLKEAMASITSQDDSSQFSLTF